MPFNDQIHCKCNRNRRGLQIVKNLYFKECFQYHQWKIRIKRRIFLPIQRYFPLNVHDTNSSILEKKPCFFHMIMTCWFSCLKTVKTLKVFLQLKGLCCSSPPKWILQCLTGINLLLPIFCLKGHSEVICVLFSWNL